jgi:hypothetical protein
MTEHQKNEVAKQLVQLSGIYGKQLDAGMVRAMVLAISDLKFEAVNNAIQKWLQEEIRFPMPADIRARVLGPTPKPADERDEGTVIAGKIWEAISRFGSYRGEQAKEFVGDRGWGAVQMLGGWRTTCESTTLDGRANFFAQVRDLLTSARRVEHQEETRETYAALPMPTLKSIE